MTACQLNVLKAWYQYSFSLYLHRQWALSFRKQCGYHMALVAALTDDMTNAGVRRIKSIGGNDVGAYLGVIRTNAVT